MCDKNKSACVSICALILSLFSPLAVAQSYEGNIDVIYAEPGYVQLNPQISIMPGESITFEVSGQVDVNHEHYEVRRCKYFGLKCWYEKRSVPHYRNARQFEVTLLLRTPDGSFEKKETRSANSDETITVSYPFRDAGTLTSAAQLYGMIDTPGMRNRTPCRGRPRYCSVGTLKIASVARSDVSTRRDQIRNELSANIRTLDPVLVRSNAYVDPLLIDTDGRRKALQAVFAEELEKAKPTEAETTFARSLVDIGKFAVGLHEDPEQVTSLNNTILGAYVVLGDWSRIKDEGGRSLETAKDLCNLSPAPESVGDPSDGCRDYARMLKLNAVGWLEQKARFSSTEIRVALGFLERGIAALGGEGSMSDAKCRANKESCRLFGELYVDGARMLTVIRTKAELRKAESWLTKALDIHQIIDETSD